MAEMTTRERFNKVLHWEKPDRAPNMDFGYWDETFPAWHEQGLPAECKTHADIERHLGLEGVDIIPRVPVNNGFANGLKHKILEDKATSRIVRDQHGVISEVPKKGSSIPRYIKFPIETREDWKRFRDDHLDYTEEKRIGDVKAAVEEAHAAGMPIRFNAGSLYGLLRDWMSVEHISIVVLSDPDWVEEMMEHMTLMTLHLIEKALPGVDVDCAFWWEDMCFKNGPLLSPQLFEDLMVPRYKRITDALKRHGVDVNILDCDGCIYRLVPGWLRGGINCMFPIEAAHTDPLKLREEYGEDILLVGGVNKRALAAGKEAIDREMERLAPLVERGGYIPTVDHRVPPDVSYENYLYYIERKKEIL